jgi:hypothetical protein
MQKRFRITQNDEISANVRYKGEIICKTYIDSGFTRIPEIVNLLKNRLDWQFKNKGKRIEISIFNKSRDQIKYINTFS